MHAWLNRHLIQLLSTLGVPDEVFLDMQASIRVHCWCVRMYAPSCATEAISTQSTNLLPPRLLSRRA